MSIKCPHCKKEIKEKDFNNLISSKKNKKEVEMPKKKCEYGKLKRPIRGRKCKKKPGPKRKLARERPSSRKKPIKKKRLIRKSSLDRYFR